jgi:hypothetical protein
MTLKRAFLIILFAFVWLIGGAFIGGAILPRSGGPLTDAFFGTLFVGFSAFMLVGFAVWAGAKGYSPWLGAVLAWLGPIGMLILVFLRDKSAERQARDLRQREQSTLGS